MEEYRQQDDLREADDAPLTDTALEIDVTKDTTGAPDPDDAAERRLAVAEAVLFSSGEAVPDTSFAAVLGIDRKEVPALMEELAARYEDAGHGIRVIRLDNAWQFCTKKEFYPDLIRLLAAPKKTTLTDVVLETLSIIAYKQPVTKAEIERIRGVNSDHAVNRLVEYHLVKELGRLNAPGRPILFGTTEEFLRCFGVENTGQLPQPDTVQVADFQAEAEEEIREK